MESIQLWQVAKAETAQKKMPLGCIMGPGAGLDSTSNASVSVMRILRESIECLVYYTDFRNK